MRALVTTSKAIDPAVAQAGPPAPVRAGIMDLAIAFPAGAQRSDDDRVRALQIYAEAVDGFHPAIAAHALKRLRLHNPRNPFPPTAQDVYECCKEVQSRWLGSVLAHYRIRGCDPDASIDHIPPDLVHQLLSSVIRAGHFDGELCRLSDAYFNAIPFEAFAPDHRERLAARRKEEAERQTKERASRERLAQAALHRRREMYGVEVCGPECIAAQAANAQSTEAGS